MKFIVPAVATLFLLFGSRVSAAAEPAAAGSGVEPPNAAPTASSAPQEVTPPQVVPTPQAVTAPQVVPTPQAVTAPQAIPTSQVVPTPQAVTAPQVIPTSQVVPTPQAASELGRHSVPIRPLLSHFAHHEAMRRYGESVVGLAGTGVLVGAGFAVEPHDKTWSSVLWVTGGVVALGSIASLLMPSALEKLERNAAQLSDEELRARWAELARAKFLERRAGAVVGALFGATGIVLGGMVMDGEWGKLNEDTRRWVGLGLITSGALGVVESGVQWFVPSPIEVGFDVAQSPPPVAFAVAPSPTGVSLAIAGAF